MSCCGVRCTSAVLILSVAALCGGCGPELHIKVPPPAEDRLPIAGVSAFSYLPENVPGAFGDIEIPNISSTAGATTTSVVSNIDVGTYVQISARGDNLLQNNTLGGVQSLSMVIKEGPTTLFQGQTVGTVDQNGEVPGTLTLYQTGGSNSPAITFHIGTTVVTVIVKATNFNGGTTELVVYYKPLDAAERKKPRSDSLVLNRISGQNTYVATAPDDSMPPANGVLWSIQGGTTATVTIMKKGVDTSQCTNLAVSETVSPFGNMPIGALAKLYGSDPTPLPVSIVGCVNPNWNVKPSSVDIRINYQWN